MSDAIESKSSAQTMAARLLTAHLPFEDGFATWAADRVAEHQEQTNAVFSEKWSKYASVRDQEKLYDFSKHWYLTLYGFDTLDRLETHLKGCKPSNARRFSKAEVWDIVADKGMTPPHCHSEEAAHSGRFIHAK
jgi:hypothetical protein